MRLASLGAAITGLAVLAGAFGAHALRGGLAPDLLQVYETAVRYQLVHGLALLLVAALKPRAPRPGMRAAGIAFTGGTLLFSGSLYALAMTGVRLWGAVTPVGGLALLAGWGCVAFACWPRAAEHHKTS